MRERFAVISAHGQILEYHKTMQKAIDRMIALGGYDVLDKKTNIYYSQNLRKIFKTIDRENKIW